MFLLGFRAQQKHVLLVHRTQQKHMLIVLRAKQKIEFEENFMILTFFRYTWNTYKLLSSPQYIRHF